jgi:hypothetical protein
MTAESRLQLESCLLAALCAGTAGASSLREMARSRLGNYGWSEAAFQAVFEIVVAFPSASPDALRDHLPALLTRRGFPDFDWAALFNAPAVTPGEVEEWVACLTETGS